MKKILSFIFLIAFVLSSINLTNAGGFWPVYTSENLGFKFMYPEKYGIKNRDPEGIVAVKVIIEEEWDTVNVVDSEIWYIIESFTVYDLSEISIENIIKNRFWENCWEYSMEEVSWGYHAWVYEIIPKTFWDYGDENSCFIYGKFMMKYSPASEKVIMSRWSQDCIITDESGNCLWDEMYESVEFVEEELSSEDKQKVENVLNYLVNFVESKYETNQQDLVYSVLEKIISEKKKTLTWNTFLLFDYLHYKTVLKHNLVR